MVMEKVYANLIRKGLKTLDDVPDRLKKSGSGTVGR
jgi:hypothetical protein